MGKLKGAWTRLRLSKEELEEIALMIELNTPAYEIALEYDISLEYLRRIKKQLIKQVLGFKDEAYATESEMLEGFKCTYDDLSEIEKNMYDLCMKRKK